MSLATCSKLSMLGNVNVLFDVSSSDANIIAHRAPNIKATGSNANILPHTDANSIATTSFVMP
ncbi:hypothetical protein MTR67_038970 [Solanum verrucosum]|uniref:Uncharacterized protein n=1 Tax=Solanum verrucosum TaxID=315347 RepID=A0AAF0UH07_SOLVR|nr:hypothetical protein MTR67_038970 [Solanum verrucosum]